MENNFKFRYYSTEELIIDRMDKNLNEEERKVRRYIINYIIDNDQAFNLDKVKDTMSKDMGFSEEKLRTLFNNLGNKRTIVADEDKNVNCVRYIKNIYKKRSVVNEEKELVFCVGICNDDVFNLRMC